MSIDEAIEDLKECDGWQVAEWLEELKQYRECGLPTIKEIKDKSYNQAPEIERYTKNSASFNSM